jgi:hypothetical protein
MAIAPNVWMVLFSTSVRAIGSAVIWVYSTLLLQIRVPNALLGRILALEMALLTVRILSKKLSLALPLLPQLICMGMHSPLYSLSGVLFCEWSGDRTLVVTITNIQIVLVLGLGGGGVGGCSWKLMGCGRLFNSPHSALALEGEGKSLAFWKRMCICRCCFNISSCVSRHRCVIQSHFSEGRRDGLLI